MRIELPGVGPVWFGDFRGILYDSPMRSCLYATAWGFYEADSPNAHYVALAEALVRDSNWAALQHLRARSYITIPVEDVGKPHERFVWIVEFADAQAAVEHHLLLEL